jgi:hypothetical protein
MFEDWKKAWRDAVENFRREMTESADDTLRETSIGPRATVGVLLDICPAESDRRR